MRRVVRSLNRLVLGSAPGGAPHEFGGERVDQIAEIGLGADLLGLQGDDGATYTLPDLLSTGTSPAVNSSISWKPECSQHCQNQTTCLDRAFPNEPTNRHPVFPAHKS